MGTSLDFSKMKVGVKSIEDAILNLGYLNQEINRKYGEKTVILKALNDRNLPTLREISNYFYSTNGIYARVCNYFAYLYRYDWYIVPEVYDTSIGEDKILKEFYSILDYLDNSNIKKICGDIALEVIKNGAYYGYKVENSDGIIL